MFPLQVDFEASNFMQVSLQPSYAHSWLKPHPLSNELAIVIAVGQWPSLQSEKIASHQKWRPYMARRPFSNPICAKEEGNGPPSAATKGFLQLGPEIAMLRTWAQGWNPPISPCPTLSAGAEPKSQGHCRKWHHKLKVVWCMYASIAYNQLMTQEHM